MIANPPLKPPAPLADRQLRALRCRSDRLGIAVLVGAVVAVILLVPGLPALALAFGAVLVWLVLDGAVGLATLSGNGVPFGPTVAAAWYRAARWVCARTGVRHRSLPVLLVQDPRPNARAVWAIHGRAVVVTSGLAALLEGDAAAQRFVVGHETGHALFHQPWLGVAGLLGGLPGPLGTFGRLAGLGWVRATERSADRLGLVCAGSAQAAARALLALSAGVPVADADVPAMLRQLPRRPGGLWGYVAEGLATHPFLRPRLEALFAYAGSRAFARLVDPEIAEAVRWELTELGLRPDRRGGYSLSK